MLEDFSACGDVTVFWKHITFCMLVKYLFLVYYLTVSLLELGKDTKSS